MNLTSEIDSLVMNLYAKDWRGFLFTNGETQYTVIEQISEVPNLWRVQYRQDGEWLHREMSWEALATYYLASRAVKFEFAMKQLKEMTEHRYYKKTLSKGIKREIKNAIEIFDS